MAQVTEPSTEPSSKKSSERRTISLEEAVEMAKQGWKFEMGPEEIAEYDEGMADLKRRHPLPTDAEAQPPKGSSSQVRFGPGRKMTREQEDLAMAAYMEGKPLPEE